MSSDKPQKWGISEYMACLERITRNEKYALRDRLRAIDVALKYLTSPTYQDEDIVPDSPSSVLLETFLTPLAKTWDGEDVEVFLTSHDIAPTEQAIRVLNHIRENARGS